MFALPKLVWLILILAALWIFYRWVNNPMRELQRKRAAQPLRPIPVEDLVACGVCGSYVASVAPSCPRPDCPRPR